MTSGTRGRGDNGSNGSGDFVYTSNVASTEGSLTDVAESTWGEMKTLFR